MERETEVKAMVAAIQAHIASAEVRHGGFRIADPMVCRDGYRVSVQGSYGHYCAPRETLRNGRYDRVECGYPNVITPEWDSYAESPGTTETVFAYVPIEEVAAVLLAHGGLKS